MPFDLNDPFSTLPLATSQIVANLLVALLCGLAISLIYRWSYRGTSYSTTFVASLVTLAMITSIVIMAIGNNLARAFGLVGAMSIIRFRTAVKDTQDLVFIFLVLAIGLAAGVGFHRLAILATVFVGATLWLLGRSGFGASRKLEYLVEIVASSESASGEDSGTAAPEAAPWDAVLARYARRHRLLHARSGEGGRLDLGFLVTLRRTEDAPALTDALGRTDRVEEVALYYDEERPL
ncbi:DUF4956 domain-containing protein [Rubricoccus marinus]|uniref:DUF4956 domain-containing protein n=1 Tax=Rubricoccus marinus TaxID=716817 RepID=A0A259TWP7_9BACT|nr:DUF4956 domain-containing protein [Rubricoccus marinus]OZC02047.1 hypothetical protein BSZ36_03050 [Rubricoccus marinus]